MQGLEPFLLLLRRNPFRYVDVRVLHLVEEVRLALFDRLDRIDPFPLVRIDARVQHFLHRHRLVLEASQFVGSSNCQRIPVVLYCDERYASLLENLCLSLAEFGVDVLKSTKQRQGKCSAK